MKKIKGIILAGGLGTRLRPLTNTTAKPLLKIGKKPLIQYSIENLVSSGITDLLVVIQSQHTADFFDLIEDGKKFGATSVTYVWHPQENIGMSGALLLCQHLINESEAALVACADMIIEENFSKLIGDYLSQKRGARALVSYMHDTAGFSLLKTTNDKIIQIFEKDATKHVPGLIDLGIGIYPYEVFGKIKQIKKAKTNQELTITDLNKLFVKEKDLLFSQINCWWSDVGRSLDEYYSVFNRYKNEK